MNFSIASVVLSYFLVGGGIFVGLLVAGVIKADSVMIVYALMAAGAAAGGFIAARASRGSTILEPAIGAVGVVATVVALGAGTELGKFLWHIAPDATMKFVGTVGGACTVGAIAGAFVSEKLLGESTTSSAPWVLYLAFATFGACMLATVFGGVIAAGKETSDIDALAKALLAGIGAGCLLAGFAGASSANARPLLASLLGGALGTAGYAYLIKLLSVGAKGESSDGPAVIAVFGAMGGVVTLVGALLGWVLVGRRHASA